MEEIYLHSLPIKEYQIVDFFLPKLKDEVMKVRRPESGGDLHYDVTLYIPSSSMAFMIGSDPSFMYRLSPSKSRPVPVSELDSRPSSSSAIQRAMSVLVSRRRRRLPLPSGLR
jgi:hypothetical protein